MTHVATRTMFSKTLSEHEAGVAHGGKNHMENSYVDFTIN